MWKTVAKWMLLTALLTISAIVSVWSAGEARKAPCTGLQIDIHGHQGADSLTGRGIADELARFDPRLLSRRAADIDLRRLERYLDGFSNFESVECSFTSQGKLRVTVVPMIPEIRVFAGDRSYYINKDGKHIAANAEFFVDVPVVTGNFSRSFPPQAVLPVTRFVAADPVLSHLISMVEARDADNIILVPRITGHVINIGDTTALPDKRERLLAMYRNVMPYKGWNTYDTISVKFRGQVVATRADKSPRSHAPETTGDIDMEEASLQGIGEEPPRLASHPPQPEAGQAGNQ